MLSEAVIIALIGNGTVLLTLIVGRVMSYFEHRSTTNKLDEAGEQRTRIETSVNGQTKHLVKVEKVISRAEGKAEGIEEERQR
jgi:hypothetical protein